MIYLSSMVENENNFFSFCSLVFFPASSMLSFIHSMIFISAFDAYALSPFHNFNLAAWKILIKFILKFIYEIRFDKFAMCLDGMDVVVAVIVIVIIVFTVIADGNAANTANTVPLPLMLGFPCLTLHSFDTLFSLLLLLLPFSSHCSPFCTTSFLIYTERARTRERQTQTKHILSLYSAKIQETPKSIGVRLIY